MADKTVNALSGLDPALTSVPQQTKAEKNDQVSKNEFITLLVTQLKNQDPLNPMENDEFAVKLAQFSQLEQLVDINEKIGSNGSDLSSMAAYLGNEVTLDTNAVEVENFEGGSVNFNLESDATDAKIELLDGLGNVRETIELGDLSAGKHSQKLSELSIESGSFIAKVTAAGANGETLEPAVQVSGVVSGFVPGADPVLIVGGKEVRPSEVVAVNVP